MSCIRIVTYNVLIARRAYRIRDISEEINAHITWLSGDAPAFVPRLQWATIRGVLGAREEGEGRGCFPPLPLWVVLLYPASSFWVVRPPLGGAPVLLFFEMK